MENKTSQKLNEKKESFAHKAGDAIERLGEKVTKAGAPNLGKKIYNAGDKLEHSQDENTENEKLNRDL